MSFARLSKPKFVCIAANSEVQSWEPQALKGEGTRGLRMNLRERGIYSLPNGRELVVLRKHENGGAAYTLVAHEQSTEQKYEVNDAGRLVSQGKLTAWEINNLTDTGRTLT